MKLVRLLIALFVMHTAHAAASLLNHQLHSAIWDDKVDDLSRLLADVADINASKGWGDNDTLLMEAASLGSIHCLNALLARGADITRQNRFGRTALMIAAGDDDCFHCVKALVDYAVAKGISLDASDDDGQTALHHAAAYGSAETVAILIAAGAATNIIAKGNRTTLHILMSTLSTGEKWRARAISIMKQLLATGVPINAQDNRRWTALHEAAYASTKKDLVVYEAMIALGADASIKNNTGKLAADLIEEKSEICTVAC